jgi:hypothetical protein
MKYALLSDKRTYHGIFIITIAAIARSFAAKIVKNAGDCLIFYHPETLDPNKEQLSRRF